MTNFGPWSTEDFESMSWHDVHVHGFRFVSFNDEEGSADLVLDIDYILEWKRDGNVFFFLVAPAALRFKDVFGLKLSLDYASPSAGMCPFSIDGISRELVEFPNGYTSYRWFIKVNWPYGEIQFRSPGFTQSLTGVPVPNSAQWLDPGLRGGRHVS